MRWPVQNRKAYYAKVAEERGDAAARQLVAAVSTEWRRIGGDRLDERYDAGRRSPVAHLLPLQASGKGSDERR